MPAPNNAWNKSVNISKDEQRVLHALAQGGLILVEKDSRHKILDINCVTREGWTLASCQREVFRKLRKRRFIRSRNGGPYRITRSGLTAVRAELNQR